MALTDKEAKEKAKILKKLGAHIRFLREKQELTAAEFGRRCDLESGNVSRIEMGRANLTFYNMVKIAKALNMSVSEMLNEFEER